MTVCPVKKMTTSLKDPGAATFVNFVDHVIHVAHIVHVVLIVHEVHEVQGVVHFKQTDKQTDKETFGFLGLLSQTKIFDVPE